MIIVVMGKIIRMVMIIIWKSGRKRKTGRRWR